MNYNNYHFTKLLSEPINNLIKLLCDTVHILSPIKNDYFRRHVKYSVNDYAIGIIDVLRSNTSWNSYSGIINGNTLRKKHNEWIKLGIYERVYEDSLKKYMKTVPVTKELKYQSIDSTFVEDINGSNYASYNGIYKRRKGESSKGIKITSIVTSQGIPFSVTINQGHQYDSPLLPNAVDECIIDCNTKKYQNHNRFKQYFLADSGYDSKANHGLLVEKGYDPIIIQNRRNIKDEKKLRTLNPKQKKIYKRRTIIENYHSWIKKFPKIKSLYERNIDSYRGLVLLGIAIVINRRIVKVKK